MRIDFQTKPDRYRHWRLSVDGPVATLAMDVDEAGGLFPGYELKLNSYDLGVDIELADAVQRLRFEHPQVKVVLLRSARERVFCAGANIRMLSGASHAHKVNFCKFTNETRNAIEAAHAESGQSYVAVINGTAAGGGYELALAADHIVLVDDNNAAVSLPEVPLLAVLPGTGGLTRVTDKRKVRRDRADIFCTLEEGIKGKRAVEWRLVDEAVKPSMLGAHLEQLCATFAGKSDRPDDGAGVALAPLRRTFGDDAIDYSHLSVAIDRAGGVATFILRAPDTDAPGDAAAMLGEGASFWPLALARELDDAILHMRANELSVGVWQFTSEGNAARVAAYDALLHANAGHWLGREIINLWKRVLKRLDVTSRTLVALALPGSCFAGFLAEVLFATDRSFMFIGAAPGDNRPGAMLHLTASNFGPLPMPNAQSRLATRFYGEPETLQALERRQGEAIGAEEAEELGLVTASYDEIDWDGEVRIMLEERASFSPDALTGLEANLRFAGPETMETKIFGRLTAWQNWIFQRPNAVGEAGALKKYGSGIRPDFSKERV